ncbi:MAG: heparinase II/III family protein, partial [Alphaproteobacteria bacterium]
QRLKALILTWGWYGASASTSQQQMIVTSIAAQRLILSKDWRGLKDGNHRIDALAGLILAHAFLNGGGDETLDIDVITDALIKTHLDLILSDGCHASRQMDRHMELLKSLIEARLGLGTILGHAEAMTPHQQEQINTLDDSIMRMGAMARMWRHADGNLIRLLGSREVDPTSIDSILDRAGPKGRVTSHAPDGGFIRMASGRSVLMMNTGPAPWVMARVMAEGGRPDAGALAIEFSNGGNPIFINAGQSKAMAKDSPDMAEALAGTAAFSTLSIDRLNAADTGAKDETGRHATSVEAETGPASGGLLAEAKHNGYEQSHGLLHQRRVFLATGGNDLRGEDHVIYTGAPGLIPHEAVIRFHLHPKINASLSIGGDVILRLPGTAAAWHFKAIGADIAVEDSVYLGRDGLEKCSQITLTMALNAIRHDHTQSVKWGLRRQQSARVK